MPSSRAITIVHSEIAKNRCLSRCFKSVQDALRVVTHWTKWSLFIFWINWLKWWKDVKFVNLTFSIFELED